MKIEELATVAHYTAFLNKKGVALELPAGDYDGGSVKVSDPANGKWAKCQIAKHPNCCGSKWLHSCTEDYADMVPYAIGGALLWCKIKHNASATYVVADHQKAIEKALKSFGFMVAQDVYNPKSTKKGNFRLYIINPLEL